MINPYEHLKPHEHTTFTYDKFCELVNEPCLNGHKKTTQIKNWCNYIDITKGYNKITLNKVYNSDEMLLIGHNVKFTEYIADLIIMYLAHSENKIETLTYKEFAEYFYMVNKNYYKAKYQKYNYENQFKLKTNLISFTPQSAQLRIKEDMGIFFNITDRIIKEIIRNALKSLRNKGLIIYSENFKIYKEIKTYDGRTITKGYICTEEQRKEFLDIRKSVMRRYNIQKLQDTLYMNYLDREKYYQDLKQAMMNSDILYHCSRYANAFNIEYGEKAIGYEYKKLMKQNRSVLNNNMQYKLLTTKEMECINNALKLQLVDSFIKT